MKKVFFIAALTAVSFAGFAQKDSKSEKALSFTAGIQADLPIGNIVSGVKFSDGASFGIGAYAQAAYSIAPELALTFHAGYTSFLAKEIDGEKGDAAGVIPVLVGAKYMFNENIYAAGQVGVSFVSNVIEDKTKSGLTYVPSIGYKTSNLDFSLNYTGRSLKHEGVTFNMNSVGLRVGYTF